MKKPFRGELGVRPPDGFSRGTNMCVFADLRELSECRTIIDLGANIGLATLYLAHAYPDARIVSVEPEESNHAILQTNLTSLIAEQRCQVSAPRSGAVIVMLSLRLAHEGGHDSYQFAESGKGQSVEALSMATAFLTIPASRSGFAQSGYRGSEVQLFEGDLSGGPRKTQSRSSSHGNSARSSRFDTI